MRGRNRSKGPNPLTRSYESNGPDVKIRGTAQHIAEKYSQLARDAQASGEHSTNAALVEDKEVGAFGARPFASDAGAVRLPLALDFDREGPKTRYGHFEVGGIDGRCPVTDLLYSTVRKQRTPNGLLVIATFRQVSRPVLG